MARDSLRATLDTLQVDAEAAKDRPYLEAMLRRLGYTEHEIRAELGPPAQPEPAPALPADDGLAPGREYRLVVPAREASFALDNDFRGPRSDAPFEDLEHVEFQETAPAEETAVEFEAISPEEPQALEEVAAPQLEEIEFVEEAPLEEFQPVEPPAESPPEELQEEPLPGPEPGAGVDDVAIDTFGGPDVGAQPKTRVRVKRVRAKSTAEAEAKVASANRRVIKSIPVDIVERWGEKGKGKKPGEGDA